MLVNTANSLLFGKFIQGERIRGPWEVVDS